MNRFYRHLNSILIYQVIKENKKVKHCDIISFLFRVLSYFTKLFLFRSLLFQVLSRIHDTLLI